MPEGGQIGNKNAEKWTQDLALELGNDLIKWLLDKPENYFFKYFLYLERQLDAGTIEYLGGKFTSFSQLIKKARNIQCMKLELGLVSNELSTAGTIFVLRTNHGQNEDKHDQYKFELPDEESNVGVNAKDISSLFVSNYHSVRNDTNITINRGGTSSTKTYSLAQLAIEFLLTGKLHEKEGKSFDIVMKTLPFLKSTAVKDLLTLIDSNGFGELFDHRKTDKEIRFKDRVIYYYSVDDEQKVKGRRRDFLWVSEADSVDWDVFRQMQMRTNLHTFIDFNPDNEFIWINIELEQKRMLTEGDVNVIQSCYKDNPFLNDKIKREIELLRQDEEYWQIFGLGNYGTITGLIFKKGEQWETYETLPDHEFYRLYVADDGYSIDPFTLLELNIHKGKREVYINEIVYETGLLTTDIIRELKEVNAGKDHEIIVDSAAARLIGEIENAGFNVYKAQKGAGSIIDGIQLMKKYKLFVHENSLSTQKELNLYKRQKKDGKYIRKPIDMFNHAIDAMRYGITWYDKTFGSKY